MLAHAGRAEIVAFAAHCDDQCIVTKAPPWRDFLTLVINMGGKPDLSPGSIEPDHLANAIAEVVPMRLRKEIYLMHAEIHGSGRNFMQQRLP